MFTFLPEEYKKTAIKSYRFRLAVIYLSLLCAFFVACAALTLPIFTVMKAQKESSALEYTTLIKNIKEDPSLFEKEVAAIQKKQAIIASTSGTQTLLSVIERVIAQKGNGIALTTLTIKRNVKTGAISVSAVASTRDALVSFSKRLQGEPSFSQVNLPVGSLARNRDIPFTIIIDSTF